MNKTNAKQRTTQIIFHILLFPCLLKWPFTRNRALVDLGCKSSIRFSEAKTFPLHFNGSDSLVVESQIVALRTRAQTPVWAPFFFFFFLFSVVFVLCLHVLSRLLLPFVLRLFFCFCFSCAPAFLHSCSVQAKKGREKKNQQRRK
jgi:hypothetical protein